MIRVKVRFFFLKKEMVGTKFPDYVFRSKSIIKKQKNKTFTPFQVDKLDSKF